MSIPKIVMSVGKFINRYGDEAALTARALTSILDGLALNPKQAADVQEAITRLEKAASAIANSKADYTVKIEKVDIVDAVNSWLDKNAAAIIKEAVKEAVKKDS